MRSAEAVRGRVALVTGAASRIGAYLAGVAAAEGYDLHLHTGRRRAELDRTARLIQRTHGVGVTTHVVDLTFQTAVEAWVPKLRRAGPALIVNNASHFPEHSEGWDAVATAIALHALAPSELVTAIPESRLGHIVNVLDARLPLLDASHTGYEVAKHSLAALTLFHARRLSPLIRVNALAPGLDLSPAGRRPGGRGGSGGGTTPAPLQRPAPIEDLGEALRFLDRATAVTGQVLQVDSGKHRRAD